MPAFSVESGLELPTKFATLPLKPNRRPPDRLCPWGPLAHPVVALALGYTLNRFLDLPKTAAQKLQADSLVREVREESLGHRVRVPSPRGVPMSTPLKPG